MVHVLKVSIIPEHRVHREIVIIGLHPQSMYLVAVFLLNTSFMKTRILVSILEQFFFMEGELIKVFILFIPTDF